MAFKIFGWHTTDSNYTMVANNYLIPSLKKLNIDSEIITINPSDNWRDGTNLKPLIAEQAINKTDKDVLLVDADAIIHSYPKLLDEIPEEYDCAVFYLKWNEWYMNGSSRIELCSGTLFFRNRPICKELIQEWKRATKVHGHKFPDQKILQTVINEFEDLKVYLLPYEYCWINSLPTGKKPFVKKPENVIIEHFQISRELKNQYKRK